MSNYLKKMGKIKNNQQLTAQFYNNYKKMIQIRKANASNFIYQDSSQDQSNSQDDIFSSQNFYLQEQANEFQANKKKYIQRDCQMRPDHFLLNDNYQQNIQKIIQQNMAKLQKKVPLLVSNNQIEILQNLQKRNLKYKLFLKQLEIDKKYKSILSQKTKKLNEQNERKKNILIKKRIKEKLIEQEAGLHKYVIQKNEKQLQTSTKIQKYLHKVGIQKIRESQKDAKQNIKKSRQQMRTKVKNLQIKQRNQLDQLKQELQQIKQIKRINELDQRKVIKDLSKSNQEQKKNLILKCSSSSTFKI